MGRASVDLGGRRIIRSEEHTSELQSHDNLVCRLLLGKTTSGTTYTSTASLRRSSPPSSSRRKTRRLRSLLPSLPSSFFLKVGRPPHLSSFPSPIFSPA